MHIKDIRQTISKLKAYRNVTFPVLSVYLDNKNHAFGAKLTEDFMHLLKHTATVEEEKKLEKQIMTIESYLSEDYDKRKHCCGIALFAGEKLWEIIHHNFPIPSQMTITHHPYISPLLDQLNMQGEDLVVIADRKKAKLFLFHNGIVEKEKVILGESIQKKIKANKNENYARNTKLQHTMHNAISKHLNTIAQQVDIFVHNKKIHAVFVGGHKPMIHKIKQHLSPILRKKISGEFIIAIKAPQNELIRKSQHAISHADMQPV